jgi:ribonuclease HI
MIYTNSDGGSRGNPGPGAIGAIVRKDGEILTKSSKFIGEMVTNNMAEYEGLISALELASKVTSKKITCMLDSELIVKQLMGEYKVKNPYLLQLFLKVQKLQEKFESIEYKHVSRWDTFQKLADGLVNEELNSKGYYKSKFTNKKN